MNKTYTRKFLIKNLPDIEVTKEIKNKRYYLYAQNSTVIRVQSEDNLYEIERKKDENHLKKESFKIQITRDEYEKLSIFAKYIIERKTIMYSSYPQLKVRIYEGKYKGLMRAEINFLSENEAKAFIPYDWLDKEITDLPIGKDITLLRLSPAKFADYLK